MSLTLRMFSPCLPGSASLPACLSLSLGIASLLPVHFGLRFSSRISTSASSFVSVVRSHSADLPPRVFVSLPLSVFRVTRLPTGSISCCASFMFLCLGLARPVLGPGHPPESAPPVFDDSRHNRLLLRLHAPRLHAPQLNRLRLRTLAGQRHGESGHLLVEPGEGGGHQVVGRAPRWDSCSPTPTLSF